MPIVKTYILKNLSFFVLFRHYVLLLVLLCVGRKFAIINLEVLVRCGRKNINAGSKGRKSGPKVGSKFGQSNNNTKHAPIGIKFGT